MTTKTKSIIAVSALALSFALGRYTVPTVIKDETKIVDNKVVRDDKKENKKKHKKTVIKQLPDGEKDTIITEDDSTDDNDTKSTTDDKTTDKTHEVVRSGGGTTVSALAALSLTNGQLVYGGQVQKDLLGPINFGLFGFTDGRFGASLGLRF